MKCPTCKSDLKSTIKKLYRYDLSGLSNIILKDIQILNCDKCGERLPTFPSITNLHIVIARTLINRPTKLTPKEFRYLRKYMNLSGERMAEIFCVRKETVSRWETDKVKIPDLADRFMRVYVATELQDENIDALCHINNTTDPDLFKQYYFVYDNSNFEWFLDTNESN